MCNLIFFRILSFQGGLKSLVGIWNRELMSKRTATLKDNFLTSAYAFLSDIQTLN